MPAFPVRTAVYVFCTALVLGGTACGMKTTLETLPTSPDAKTTGPGADASPSVIGDSGGFGLPDAAALTSPDVATDAQVSVNGPDLAPARNPDALSTPTAPDGSTVPVPPDASALGSRDSGGTSPDSGRPVPTRDGGVVIGRDGGITIPGFGSDAGFTFPTRPDSGLTIPGFGNDAGFTFPGFGDVGFTFPGFGDGGFTITTGPGTGGPGNGGGLGGGTNGGGFGGGTNGGGAGRGNGGAGRGNGG